MATKMLQTAERSLKILPAELCLAAVLRNGQSFRWHKRITCQGELWSIAWSDRTIELRQDGTAIYYRALYPLSAQKEHELDEAQATTLAILRRYLSLSISLSDLYAHWSSRDPNFVKQTDNGRFGGIRVLRQPIWETIVAFICSSNNNIARIGLMISRLCESLGSKMPSSDSAEEATVMYSFPSPEAIGQAGNETLLRQLGFGYRAEYVVKTAQMVQELAKAHNASLAPGEHLGVEAYLDSWSKLSYTDAREQLLQLCGVGPKVADCIALFGLGFAQTVPVDRHVWQIAIRDYHFNIGKGREKDGPMSKEIYVRVQTKLQDLWGDYAGWAQQVLFTADLRSFANYENALLDSKINVIADVDSSASVKSEEATTEMEGEDIAALVHTPAPRRTRKELLTSTKKRRIVRSAIEAYPTPSATPVKSESEVADVSLGATEHQIDVKLGRRSSKRP
ncbi:uncharacterized protein L969DRAFT_46362 [Mixia osmundae IAM 14324]|uniref:DNA-(apurinic or apyrimidinic site) lyase n=1 Tax=Mixia osmundae (strain CBS 9802 / IAM 14324 / JCM 22182 / KY 12970) TaxID=764103 RepID=G7E586_MIXOS|nr:uncharacterized protein L969DRAFT_46362 [Mixia osmundae IAM 14324]KEI40854.1 hypothetical protein L969DRAFT_46362 [Mixia osmundae IAM 14324]GAA97996.1 hypothetical protein E5Q_04676 [Mixia osmundae IAM 14324]